VHHSMQVRKPFRKESILDLERPQSLSLGVQVLLFLLDEIILGFLEWAPGAARHVGVAVHQPPNTRQMSIVLQTVAVVAEESVAEQISRAEIVSGSSDIFNVAEKRWVVLMQVEQNFRRALSDLPD